MYQVSKVINEVRRTSDVRTDGTIICLVGMTPPYQLIQVGIKDNTSLLVRELNMALDDAYIEFTNSYLLISFPQENRTVCLPTQSEGPTLEFSFGFRTLVKSDSFLLGTIEHRDQVFYGVFQDEESTFKNLFPKGKQVLMMGNHEKILFYENSNEERSFATYDYSNQIWIWKRNINEYAKKLNLNKWPGIKFAKKVFHKEYLFGAVNNCGLTAFNWNDGQIEWYHEKINDLIRIEENKLLNIDATGYRELELDTGSLLSKFSLKESLLFHKASRTDNDKFTFNEESVFVLDQRKSLIAQVNRRNGLIQDLIELDTYPGRLTNVLKSFGTNLLALKDEGHLIILTK